MNESDKSTVLCPICDKNVYSSMINEHIDTHCKIGLKMQLNIGSKNIKTPSTTPQNTPRAKRPLEEDSVEVNRPPPLSTHTAKRPLEHDCDNVLVSPTTPKAKKMLQSNSLEEEDSNKTETKTKNNSVRSQPPLAELVRPDKLSDFFGQKALLAPNGLISNLINNEHIPSLIFWGPPGCGKTTLAKLLGRLAKEHKPPKIFHSITAVTHGIEHVKKIIDQAKNQKLFTNQDTILFVDEIHRFSKAQQDIFLPAVELGHVILLGATTENPSFRVNSALTSRCKVVVLDRLEDSDLLSILERAVMIKCTEKGSNLPISQEGLKYIAYLSDGDARNAINQLDLILSAFKDISSPITIEQIQLAIQKSHSHYDQSGEEHYNLISALHKSVRGGSCEGALYWLARMLEGGEDPLYIGRRMIRMASEDIGLGDSQALPLALATYQSCQVIGRPECDVILAHCATYLAQAQKSILVYKAYNQIRDFVKKNPSYPVPLHIRNAPTDLMKNLNYGKDYVYNPDFSADDPKVLAQTYLPRELEENGTAKSFRNMLTPPSNNNSRI